MATIFNMYKDIASPNVTTDIRGSRRENEANTQKTQDTAFGMLKSSNIGTLQQQYREGKGRFAGITDPDKKFQVYYDALKALDPQAAQDAAKVYGEERQRRINREIGDAYSQAGSSGNPEIDNLRKYIESLKTDIASTEALETTGEQEQGYTPNTDEPTSTQTTPNAEPATETQSADETQTEAQDYGYYNPSINTGRMNQPLDRTLAPDEGMPAGELQKDWSKFGNVPSPNYDLKRMYGFNPEFDISLSRGQPTARTGEVRQQSTPTAGMEDYVPASRYDGYVPMTRKIANMYRGI